MKKYLAMILMFLGALIVLPKAAQAQYNPNIYMNNALLVRALAYQKARQAGNRKKVVRKRSSRRRAVRRTRRVSQFELNDFRRDSNFTRPRQIEIV